MRYTRVFQGQAMETVNFLLGPPIYHPGKTATQGRWVTDPGAPIPGPGQTVVAVDPIPDDATTRPYDTQEKPLAEARSDRIAEVESRAAQAESQGVTVDGVSVGTSEAAQNLLNRAKVYLDADPGGSVRRKWSDGQHRTVNHQTIKDMHKAVGDHMNACALRQEQLETEINGAATVAEVFDVAVGAGWPV